MDPKRELLRHTIATVAYRGGKAVRNAPDSFAEFHASETTRTPVQILSHIGDLYDWALSMAKGAETWKTPTPKPWAERSRAFTRAETRFDEFLASDAELAVTCERLFRSHSRLAHTRGPAHDLAPLLMLHPRRIQSRTLKPAASADQAAVFEFG